MLSPGSQSFNRNGSTGTFRVDTGDGCAWTATAAAEWVTIESGSGSGAGTVRYRVAANQTTAPRSTTIAVAGHQHHVSQDAGRPQRIEVEGRISNLSGSCPNVSFTVAGRIVFTDSNTTFDDGSCRDLVDGIEVEVDGELLDDGRIRATEVEIDD